MDQIIDRAKTEMGALEALFKGLPGIRDYVDKDLRRAADKRLRDQLADHLQEQKTQLIQLQKQLLERQGLKWVAKVDTIVQRLQITIDRIRTASYGYAGFFSDTRIREEELDSLYHFDQMLAEEVVAVDPAVTQLAAARSDEEMSAALNQLTTVIGAVDSRFGRRKAAIESPDILSTLYDMKTDLGSTSELA